MPGDDRVIPRRRRRAGRKNQDGLLIGAGEATAESQQRGPSEERMLIGTPKDDWLELSSKQQKEKLVEEDLVLQEMMHASISSSRPSTPSKKPKKKKKSALDLEEEDVSTPKKTKKKKKESAGSSSTVNTSSNNPLALIASLPISPKKKSKKKKDSSIGATAALPSSSPGQISPSKKSKKKASLKSKYKELEDDEDENKPSDLERFSSVFTGCVSGKPIDYDAIGVYHQEQLEKQQSSVMRSAASLSTDDSIEDSGHHSPWHPKNNTPNKSSPTKTKQRPSLRTSMGEIKRSSRSLLKLAKDGDNNNPFWNSNRSLSNKSNRPLSDSSDGSDSETNAEEVAFWKQSTRSMMEDGATKLQQQEQHLSLEATGPMETFDTTNSPWTKRQHSSSPKHEQKPAVSPWARRSLPKAAPLHNTNDDDDDAPQQKKQQQPEWLQKKRSHGTQPLNQSPASYEPKKPILRDDPLPNPEEPSKTVLQSPWAQARQSLKAKHASHKSKIPPIPIAVDVGGNDHTDINYEVEEEKVEDIPEWKKKQRAFLKSGGPRRNSAGSATFKSDPPTEPTTSTVRTAEETAPEVRLKSPWANARRSLKPSMSSNSNLSRTPLPPVSPEPTLSVEEKTNTARQIPKWATTQKPLAATPVETNNKHEDIDDDEQSIDALEDLQQPSQQEQPEVFHQSVKDRLSLWGQPKKTSTPQPTRSKVTSMRNSFGSGARITGDTRSGTNNASGAAVEESTLHSSASLRGRSDSGHSLDTESIQSMGSLNDRMAAYLGKTNTNRTSNSMSISDIEYTKSVDSDKTPVSPWKKNRGYQSMSHIDTDSNLAATKPWMKSTRFGPMNTPKRSNFKTGPDIVRTSSDLSNSIVGSLSRDGLDLPLATKSGSSDEQDQEETLPTNSSSSGLSVKDRMKAWTKSSPATNKSAVVGKLGLPRSGLGPKKREQKQQPPQEKDDREVPPTAEETESAPNTPSTKARTWSVQSPAPTYAVGRAALKKVTPKSTPVVVEEKNNNLNESNGSLQGSFAMYSLPSTNSRLVSPGTNRTPSREITSSQHSISSIHIPNLSDGDAKTDGIAVDETTTSDTVTMTPEASAASSLYKSAKLRKVGTPKRRSMVNDSSTHSSAGSSLYASTTTLRSVGKPNRHKWKTAKTDNNDDDDDEKEIQPLPSRANERDKKPKVDSVPTEEAKNEETPAAVASPGRVSLYTSVQLKKVKKPPVQEVPPTASEPTSLYKMAQLKKVEKPNEKKWQSPKQKEENIGQLYKMQQLRKVVPPVADKWKEPELDITDLAAAQGNQKVLVLISTTSGRQDMKTAQERALIILKGMQLNPDQLELLDGADLENRDRRNALFAISGIWAQYPQFFLISGNNETKFLGNWETFETLHEVGSLSESMNLDVNLLDDGDSGNALLKKVESMGENVQETVVVEATTTSLQDIDDEGISSTFSVEEPLADKEEPSEEVLEVANEASVLAEEKDEVESGSNNENGGDQGVATSDSSPVHETQVDTSDIEPKSSPEHDPNEVDGKRIYDDHAKEVSHDTDTEKENEPTQIVDDDEEVVQADDAESESRVGPVGNAQVDRETEKEHASLYNEEGDDEPMKSHLDETIEENDIDTENNRTIDVEIAQQDSFTELVQVESNLTTDTLEVVSDEEDEDRHVVDEEGSVEEPRRAEQGHSETSEEIDQVPTDEIEDGIAENEELLENSVVENPEEEVDEAQAIEMFLSRGDSNIEKKDVENNEVHIQRVESDELVEPVEATEYQEEINNTIVLDDTEPPETEATQANVPESQPEEIFLSRADSSVIEEGPSSTEESSPAHDENSDGETRGEAIESNEFKERIDSTDRNPIVEEQIGAKDTEFSDSEPCREADTAQDEEENEDYPQVDYGSTIGGDEHPISVRVEKETEETEDSTTSAYDDDMRADMTVKELESTRYSLSTDAPAVGEDSTASGYDDQGEGFPAEEDTEEAFRKPGDLARFLSDDKNTEGKDNNVTLEKPTYENYYEPENETDGEEAKDNFQMDPPVRKPSYRKTNSKRMVSDKSLDDDIISVDSDGGWSDDDSATIKSEFTSISYGTLGSAIVVDATIQNSNDKEGKKQLSELVLQAAQKEKAKSASKEEEIVFTPQLDEADIEESDASESNMDEISRSKRKKSKKRKKKKKSKKGANDSANCDIDFIINDYLAGEEDLPTPKKGKKKSKLPVSASWSAEDDIVFEYTENDARQVLSDDEAQSKKKKKKKVNLDDNTPSEHSKKKKKKKKTVA